MARSIEPAPSKTDEPPPPRPGRGPAWILFVAGRYLRTRRRERRNATAALSVLGLAVGVAVLITVLSVMNALQFQTIESIVAFNSFHIRISGLTAERLLESPPRLQELRRKLPTIETLVQFADLQAMARGYFSGSVGLRLRAVPPEILRLDEGLARALTITEGAFELARPGTVVLGYELARSLGVGPGDHIGVVTVAPGESLANPRETQLEVSGIFRVGYTEFDQYAAFVSMDSARAMVSQLRNVSLGIKLRDRESDWLAVEDISRLLVGAKMASRTVLQRDLVTWRQYNSAIFGALRVEKLMMMLIIGLIFVVVAVNIFYALRRSVVEKTEDIGVLRALGSPGWSVRLVFVTEGAGIGLIGAGAGLGLGWLLATHIADVFWLAEAAVNQVRLWFTGNAGDPAGLGRISLFYLDHVPSSFLPGEALGISVVAFLSALAASLAASRRVSRILPAEILRAE